MWRLAWMIPAALIAWAGVVLFHRNLADSLQRAGYPRWLVIIPGVAFLALLIARIDKRPRRA